MDTVEFFDNAAYVEGSEISQAGAPSLEMDSCVQLFCSESSIAKVFGLIRLNILPFFIFLVSAETMLSRSRSAPKFCLARAIISVM
jgi:hypothetical protein